MNVQRHSLGARAPSRRGPTPRPPAYAPIRRETAAPSMPTTSRTPSMRLPTAPSISLAKRKPRKLRRSGKGRQRRMEYRGAEILLIDDVRGPSGRERATLKPAWAALVDGKPSWVTISLIPHPHVTGFSLAPVDEVLPGEALPGIVMDGLGSVLVGVDATVETALSGVGNVVLGAVGVVGALGGKAERQTRRAQRKSAVAAWLDSIKTGRAGRKAIRQAKRSSKSTDYIFEEDKGRYVYRIFHKSGKILIMESPVRKYPAGLEVKQGTPAYSAIKKAIAAQKQQKRESTVLALVQVANAAAELVPASSSSRGQSSADDYDVDSGDDEASSADAGSEIPWVPIAAGGFALVAVFGVLAARRG